MHKENVIVINLKKKKTKKGTPGISMIGRMVDVQATAGKAFISEYLDGHRKSNRKKRDGWLYHMGGNIYKASFKAIKKARFSKMIKIQ